MNHKRVHRDLSSGGLAGAAAPAQTTDAGRPGPVADAEPAAGTLVDGFHGRHAGGRPGLPDAEHRGRLHAGMRRDRSRPLAARPARGARPRPLARRDRPAAVASSSTTGRSLPGARSTRGPTRAASRCASFDRASRSRTRTSKASTASFGTNASTSTGLSAWPTRKAAIEAWRVDYNSVRPHSSLDGATPDQFAQDPAGARRLTPARPDQEDEDRKPEDLTLSL